MKKFSNHILILLILASTLITSCSGDSGESNGTTTGNYLPLTINNRWKYNIIGQGVQNEIKIIGTTKFSGNTYYEFSDDVNLYNEQQWFNKRGASYFYKIGDIATTENGIFITIKSYELPMLKDDYELNRTWSGSVSPKVTYSGAGSSGSLPFNVTYTGQILFKGEVTLNGIVYPNVIKSKLDLTINANGQLSYGSEEYWFAENIGLIKILSNDNGINQENEIENFTLN